MRARRGIALLIVVLLSALVLMTIVGVGSVLVQEKIMVTSEHGFKDALAVAEAGMAQATANMQNAHKVDGTWEDPISTEFFKLFTLGKLEEIATTTGVVDLGSQVVPFDSAMVLRLKAQNLSGGTLTGGTLPDGTLMKVMSMGERYVNDDAATDGAATTSPLESTLVGRRVLEATYRLKKNTVSVWDYAMYAGGQIDFKGNNSSVSGGDIFADGDINLQKKGPRLLPAGTHTVYSGGTVSNNNGDLVKDSGDGIVPITLHPPTLASMKLLAYEFRTGTGPYDVIKPTPPPEEPDKYLDYPSTRYLKAYFAQTQFLGAEPGNVDTMSPATFVGVGNLTADLVLYPQHLSDWINSTYPTGGNPDQNLLAHAEASALLARNAAGDYVNLVKATYYVEVAKKNDKLGDPGPLHAIGTIAVNPLQGELQLAGKAVIDSGQSLMTAAWWSDSSTSTGLSMFIYGDLKGTGTNSETARLNGQFTVTGSFNGGGNFTIDGQLLVSQNITVAGNFYLTYVRSSEGSGESSTLEFVLEGTTWHEETLDTFKNFK